MTDPRQTATLPAARARPAFFNRHLVAALLLLTLVCLAGVGWLTRSNLQAATESEELETQTRKVFQQLGDLLSSLKDAETGQRGFIITGIPDYLEPYQSSLDEIAIGLTDLRRLTADSPRHQQRLDALTPLVAAKLADLKETIALRETQGSEAASKAVATQSGKKIMDEIRVLVAKAQAEEAQLLKARVATHAADYRRTTQSVTLGSALGGLALLLLFMRLRWEQASRRRGETVLQLSEQRLRLATDAAELGIWSWQPDGESIRGENVRAYAILGLPLTAAPLTAARFAAEFVHPEDLTVFEQATANTMQHGARFFYQGRFYRPDGALRWFEFTGQPMPGTGGRSLRVLGTVQDITARKQTEQLVRESEAHYRSLFDSIDEGFCVVEMLFDEHEKALDFRFLEVNPAFEQQTGLRDAVGQRMRELNPDIDAQWYDIFGQVALTGEAIRFTHEAKTLGGRWYDVYAFRFDAAPSGKVAVLIHNVTARAQAEEALRHSEQRFRALFEKGPIAIYSCDIAGNILEINHAAVDLWGAPQPGECDAQFRGALKYFLPDGSTLLPYAHTWMSQVLKGALTEVHNQEVVIERADGSRITVITNIVPLKNVLGEITGAINCFYDITERSRLERETQAQAQALAELDSRKDEFLAMLGHELRNPLAALTNAVQLMRQHKHVDPLLLQGRAIIGRQLGHLTHLVDDLLEVARINSGSVRLRQQTVELSGIVERALETAQPMILQHRHQLTLALPPEPIFLHADAARLEQVLVNLLTNAAKYTDDGGRIDLSVEQDGNEAVLKVRDNGIGIAPELLPHIFDLFTQAERSLDRAQGGLGIGLCLVQRLVQLHGGSVEAHSVLGQGSEFVVRLPALPLLLTTLPESPTAPNLPASSAPASDSALPPKKASSGCRVLVVDDNVDAAQSMAKLLERTGHATRLSYDGPSALQAALDYRPEVVLLDIGLPGLDGYQVAERIRQQAELKNIVLVALTGYGQDSDRQRSQEAGFDHHLVKPSDFDDIENILAGVASLRKA